MLYAQWLSTCWKYNEPRKVHLYIVDICIFIIKCYVPQIQILLNYPLSLDSNIQQLYRNR